MTRMTHGLMGFSLLASLALAAPVSRAQDTETPAPLPSLAPTPPPAEIGAVPQGSVQTLGPIATEAPMSWGEPVMGCGSCGGIHRLGHGCFSVHRAWKQVIPGRRPVRLWDTCKHPLNRLSGPPGYWDSPGPMAGESIVPGAAFDRTPLPIGQMVP